MRSLHEAKNPIDRVTLAWRAMRVGLAGPVCDSLIAPPDPATQGLHLDAPELLQFEIPRSGELLRGGARGIVNSLLAEYARTEPVYRLDDDLLEVSRVVGSLPLGPFLHVEGGERGGEPAVAGSGNGLRTCAISASAERSLVPASSSSSGSSARWARRWCSAEPGRSVLRCWRGCITRVGAWRR